MLRAPGRSTRYILLALGGAIALVALGLALLVALVDAGRFRPQIAAAIEAATGYPLRIDGEVRLDLLPSVALAVEDVALANPPGFSAPDLLRWRELTLGARLVPLLRGELELTRLRLVGPDLRLERRADGSVNWARLAAASPRGGGALPLRSIAGIELRDGRFVYLDAQAGTRLELDDVSVDVPQWRMGAPLPIAAGATWRRSGAPAMPIAIETWLEWAADAPRLRDTRVVLRWRATEAATGLALQLDAPRLEFDAATATLGGAPLEWRLGSGRDPLAIRDWRVSARDGGANVVAAIALEAASLRRLLEESGIGAPLTSDPGALGTLHVAASLRVAPDEWRLAPLELRLDATTLRGSALRSAGGPVEIDLAGDHMDIGRYLEPADAPTPPFVFPTAALRALPARATLRLESATLGDARLEGVTLRLVGDANGLRTERPVRSAR